MGPGANLSNAQASLSRSGIDARGSIHSQEWVCYGRCELPERFYLSIGGPGGAVRLGLRKLYEEAGGLYNFMLP